jgi:hypothetical protein
MQRQCQNKGNRKIEAETMTGATQLEIVMGIGVSVCEYYHFFGSQSDRQHL